MMFYLHSRVYTILELYHVAREDEKRAGFHPTRKACLSVIDSKKITAAEGGNMVIHPKHATRAIPVVCIRLLFIG